MVNKASQEYTGVYTKRFENISFSFRLEFTRLGPRGRDRPWQFDSDGSHWGWFGQVFTGLASDSFRLFRFNSFLCFQNDILWSLKHLRTQIDYIH